jgi:adenine-specific DNA glycosylase
MRLWPDPKAFIVADEHDVINVIKPLGFANHRAKTLRRMTEAFLTNSWKHASELPGIGQYAARAWEIFCKGILSAEPPKDHALVQYWTWAQNCRKTL